MGLTRHLVWSRASDEDAGDSIWYYEVDVNGIDVAHVVGGATSCRMSGLTSGASYAMSVTAYSWNGAAPGQWSGAIGGPVANLGRLSANYSVPAGPSPGGTIACLPDQDSDGDGLPDAVENNTGLYLSPSRTGTKPMSADSDGDGISDGDEVLGTTGGLFLPSFGVNPNHKDLLVEMDWFDDNSEPQTCGPHSHRPSPAQINQVAGAYASGPVSNPDGINGIHFIADYGQGGAFTGGNLVADDDGNVNWDSSFDAIKAANFANNRNGYFHYQLHTHHSNNSYSSGIADLPGDDSVIAMACFSQQSYNPVGYVAYGAGTIMHELGHNLGLRHGGFEDVNDKPNYNSVMNYRYQDGIDTNCNGQPYYTYANRPLQISYSGGTRPALNENNLDESKGVCGGAGPAIDWNGDGVIDPPGVSANINPDGDAIKSVLSDNNDWTQINFLGLNGGNGAPVTPPQVVFEPPLHPLP